MNLQRFVASVAVTFVAGTVLSGCTAEQGPASGIIAEPTELSVGQPIHNFPVRTADGLQTSFGELREPIAIVAFVSPNGSRCCQLNPMLVSLADDLSHMPITVAQISEPTNKCSRGPSCLATCNLKNSHLVSLCDANRIAWNAYFRPKANAVVLVDSRGEVVAVSNLANLDAVADKARCLARLADEVEALEESAWRGI